jgi:UDP-N-acetyl-D-mannosaminuronic acid dehydrogenase
LEISRTLLAQGYDVVAVEPNIEKHAFLHLSNLAAALKESDVVAVLVKHREFVQPAIKQRLRELGALDFCGALICAAC